MTDELKLSEHIKQWRADRPDEWKMDEFIREAAALEKKLLGIKGFSSLHNIKCEDSRWEFKE